MKTWETGRASAAIVVLILLEVVGAWPAEAAGPDATLGAARAAIRAANYEPGLTLLNEFLSKNSGEAMGWCLKGEIQTRVNDVAGAQKSFERAMEIDANSICALVGKANAIALSGNKNASLALLQRAVSMEPKTPYEYLARGAAHRGLDRYQEAIADYDAAIKKDATFAEAHLNKGMVYWHNGNYGEALPCFSEAIRIDPNYVEALTNRGAAYRKTGDIELAISDYSKAISINPNDAMTFYNRGVAYQKQQANEKAIEDFSAAVRLKPQYPEAYLNRGVAYLMTGKNAEAKKDFDTVISQDPSGEAGRKARMGLQQLGNL